MLEVTSANILGEGDAQPQSSLLVRLPRQITDQAFGVGGVFCCDWRRNRVRLLKKYERSLRESRERKRDVSGGEQACCVHACVCVVCRCKK